MKKILSLILVSIFVLSTVCITSFASSSEIADVSVTYTADGESFRVKAWENGERLYLFMPDEADLSALTLEFTAQAEVNLNGTVIESGDVVSFAKGESYVLSSGEKTVNLTVLQSSETPSLHITTESGSMNAVHADKSYKEPATIKIVADDEVIIDKELEYIKGRGNATWAEAKKPYNIKFKKKTELFGMDKAKKWTLLANYNDDSIIRNALALDLAQEIGISYTSSYIYVELYINDEYYGNYLLCESVEIGDGRVEINDLEGETEDANPDIDLEDCAPGGDHTTDFKKLVAGSSKWFEIPNDPEDITGGYLLEYELPDRYVDEASGFVTERNQTIVIKSPEYASKAQVEYISSLYQEFEDAVYSETGYNSLGKHYSEYIDMESCVKMYVFQEFVKNLDAGITSFYLCKDTDSDKFFMAPVWDFDKSFGFDMTRYGMNLCEADKWWASVIYHFRENAINGLDTILNALYRQDDFFALAKEMWADTLAPVTDGEYLDEVYAKAEEIKDSAVMNAIRWNKFKTADYDETLTAYLDYVQTKVIGFISERKAFMNKGFSDTAVRVFYDANGGSGNMFYPYAAVAGETITLSENSFTNGSLVFDCWNTKADGSGETYLPGSSVVLSGDKVTFYAQWKEAQTPEEPTEPEENNCSCNCHKSGFMSIMWKIVRFFCKIFGTNKTCDCGVSHY